MKITPLTSEQHDAILDREGHEPCPGVDIEFKRPLARASNGPDLHATIFRPKVKSSDATPALLAFHGGGFQGGNPDGCGDLGKTLALTLGITTISASYRLATKENPTFPGLLFDALHAWRWVQEQASELQIDPTRVAVSGTSAGVVPATHLAVNSPFIALSPEEPHPAALLANWGPIDLVARWFDNRENAGAERMLLGCHYEQNPSLYHRASPISYATGSLPPALFIYGRQDPIVHARQATLGHNAWQQAGAHSERNILNNIGHDIEGDNRPQRAEALRITTGFMAARL